MMPHMNRQQAGKETTYNMLEQLPKRLRSDVEALCDIDRQIANPRALEAAATFVENSMKRAGCVTASQRYRAFGANVRNVMTHVGPENGPRIVVGAHYDVCGSQPGADDNASSVAVLLELARELRENPPPCRVDLVAYTLEEPPAFGSEKMGSYVHARSLHTQQADVIGMVCLEHVGYFTNKPRTQRTPAGASTRLSTTGNFICGMALPCSRDWNQHVLDCMVENGMPAEPLCEPAHVVGITYSDQYNYWDHGYQAMMLTDTAFFRHNHYHMPSDTPDILNYTEMAKIVHGMLTTVNKTWHRPKKNK